MLQLSQHWSFARECTTLGTRMERRRETHFYQLKKDGKQEKNQMGLLTMDDGIVNWGEHTEVEETNHALMAISSSNELRLEIPNEKVVSELQEVDPSCAKHVKTPRQPLKDKETHKVNRKNWNDMMERELGEGLDFNTGRQILILGSAVKTLQQVMNWKNSLPNSIINRWTTFIRAMCVYWSKGRPSVKALGPKRDQLSLFFCAGNIHEELVVEMPDENQILLKVPRHHNMYSFDMKTPTPAKGFACLIAKATSDESKLWHRSMLGKFDGKSDEGFLVGYSLNSKAYRVYNLVTKRVEVNLHVNFLEDKPNVKGIGYCLDCFDIDYLTMISHELIPVLWRNQAAHKPISL
ncbi:hypothetical protein Tco_1310387 [Tanacetum coccineum]